jgi:hypothetical protein
MKRLLLVAAFIFTSIGVFACPVCEKQQPALLKGISHGTGPQSNWDMVIIWATIVLVAITLFFSIKFLVRPGEKSETHIKRFILDND